MKKTDRNEQIMPLQDEALERVIGGIGLNDALGSLKEKDIQTNNDTNTDVDRASIQKEIDQTIMQIDDNELVTVGNHGWAGNP